jgi:uncharacterized damage-inducible protein DinB
MEHTMNVQDLHRLFAYNRWANAELLEAASRLSADDFSKDLGASFGSLRGTLAHILFGERRWLQFWIDGRFSPAANLDAYPDTTALAAAWDILDRDRAAFAASLTDERLAARVSVDENSYALGDLIQHILNHSTYHRGQVVLLLRQLGHQPPATDYRLFLTKVGVPELPPAIHGDSLEMR